MDEEYVWITKKKKIHINRKTREKKIEEKINKKPKNCVNNNHL